MLLLCLALGSGCVFQTEYADPRSGGTGGFGGDGGDGGQGGDGGTIGRGDAEVCEPCTADLDCKATDNRCVPMNYNGSPFPDAETGFCLQIAERNSGGPGPDFDCKSPYPRPLSDRVSLSGAEPNTYCGVREAMTTCPAVIALDNDLTCPGQSDDECPEGALCRNIEVSRDTLEWRCTYECTDSNQCSGPGRDPHCHEVCINH